MSYQLTWAGALAQNLEITGRFGPPASATELPGTYQKISVGTNAFVGVSGSAIVTANEDEHFSLTINNSADDAAAIVTDAVISAIKLA